MQQLRKQQLQLIYQLVDNVAFSRPKKNINRDFSDGVMMAELLHKYHKILVDLHNYPQANSVATKLTNWTTLNSKVLRKIGITYLKKQDLENIVNCVPGAIEGLLKHVFMKCDKQFEEAILTLQESFGEEPSFQQAAISQQPQQRGGVSTTNVKGNDLAYLQDPIRQQDAPNIQQIRDLEDKIDQAYMQLLKLQDIAKAKDALIRNLEKKLDTFL